MNLLAYDPYANPSLAAAANVELLSSMDELLAKADFLTIHTPMIASTKGIIGASELSKMKSSARILNVSLTRVVFSLPWKMAPSQALELTSSRPSRHNPTASYRNS